MEVDLSRALVGSEPMKLMRITTLLFPVGVWWFAGKFMRGAVIL